jgi:PKD repeat protein
MKLKHTLYTLVLLSCTVLSAQNSVRRCGTMENLEKLKQQDPGLESRMKQLEQQTQEWIKSHPQQKTNAVITIPVVIHIVYNTSAENISDAQAKSVIDVLNEDFNKKNADITKVPSAFQSLIGDVQINFCLAQKDPTGKSTTGIIRKKTNVTSFSLNDNMKYSSKGGDDIWDRDKYLNIWSCNLTGGILGYATFPGQAAAAVDGVVILYTAFGRTGNVKAPYDKGRTVTHEVGHWLNLYHIWGDSNCGNDEVSDTPTQQDANYGCPSFPNVTCSNGPNGDMFMNYMDYVDDDCMHMFTAGQAARVNATMNVSRSSLKSSDACNGPSVPPIADFLVSATTTCSGTISFTDQSTNNPTSWTWDFGDGQTSTQQHPSNTYTASGTYTVKLTATNSFGSDAETKSSLISVNIPVAPTVNGSAICGPGTATLTASGSDSLRWYTAPSGGSAINTGSLYLPAVSTNTTFYVASENVLSVQKVGEVNNSKTGSNFNSTDRRLIFDVFADLTIKSFVLYPGSPGNRIIEILNGSGTVVTTFTASVNSAAMTRVPVNVTLPAGTDYAIKLAASSPTTDLYRNNGGNLSYPYTVSNLISIKNTDAAGVSTDYYYFFYDWEVQGKGCVSARVPVTAIVNAPPIKPVISQNGNVLSSSASSGNQWYLDGNLIFGATSTTYTVTQDGDYAVKVTDGNDCSVISDKLTVKITGVIAADNRHSFQIYPQPSSGFFTLAGEGIDQKIELHVYTLSGQLVYAESIRPSGKKILQLIDLSGLDKGIYLIRLTGSDKTWNHKLVLQ